MAKKISSAESSTLVDAAKAIGTAAGKIASLLGVKPEPKPARKPAAGKLPKKNKDRLPRKEKKTLVKRKRASQQP
jgi:hypothetical protein